MHCIAVCHIIIRDVLSPRGANYAPPTYVGKVLSSAREPTSQHTFRVWGCRFISSSPDSVDVFDVVYFPVVYCQDGQNLMDASTSWLGTDWGLGSTATSCVQASICTALMYAIFLFVFWFTFVPEPPVTDCSRARGQCWWVTHALCLSMSIPFWACPGPSFVLPTPWQEPLCHIIIRDELSPRGGNCAPPTYVGKVLSSAREPSSQHTFRVWGCRFISSSPDSVDVFDAS